MIDYIMDQYGEGRLMPAAGNAGVLSAIKYWLHAFGRISVLRATMVLNLMLSRMETAKMPFFAKPGRQKNGTMAFAGRIC